MPPESPNTWNKKLCKSCHDLHRWIVGDNHVDMSKFICQYPYLKRFLEYSWGGIFYDNDGNIFL